MTFFGHSTPFCFLPVINDYKNTTQDLVERLDKQELRHQQVVHALQKLVAAAVATPLPGADPSSPLPTSQPYGRVCICRIQFVWHAKLEAVMRRASEFRMPRLPVPFAMGRNKMALDGQIRSSGKDHAKLDGR